MSWSHKQAMFYRHGTETLDRCAHLLDTRGAEYDTREDSFKAAPTVFQKAVERAILPDADKSMALRLAVLADVKIQRIQSGRAKVDSYLDLINYVAALVPFIEESQGVSGIWKDREGGPDGTVTGATLVDRIMPDFPLPVCQCQPDQPSETPCCRAEEARAVGEYPTP